MANGKPGLQWVNFYVITLAGMSIYLITFARLHWQQLLHLLHCCCPFFAIHLSPFMYLHGCLLLCCSGFVCSCCGVLHGCAIICHLVLVLARLLLVLYMSAAASTRKVPTQCHISLRRTVAQGFAHSAAVCLKCVTSSQTHLFEGSLLIRCRLVC